MFLHYLLKEEPQSMISKVFKSQYAMPKKGDWSEAVKEDLQNLPIELSLDEISNISKHNFKSKVHEAIQSEAFKWSINQKNKLRKISHIIMIN